MGRGNWCTGCCPPTAASGRNVGKWWTYIWVYWRASVWSRRWGVGMRYCGRGGQKRLNVEDKRFSLCNSISLYLDTPFQCVKATLEREHRHQQLSVKSAKRRSKMSISEFRRKKLLYVFNVFFGKLFGGRIKLSPFVAHDSIKLLHTNTCRYQPERRDWREGLWAGDRGERESAFSRLCVE